MDALSLGIFNAVPRCVLRVPGRESGEHRIGNRRIKEPMKEVVENLKYDTVRCRLNAITNVEIALGIDSLRNELKKAISGQINANALYISLSQFEMQLKKSNFWLYHINVAAEKLIEEIQQKYHLK